MPDVIKDTKENEVLKRVVGDSVSKNFYAKVESDIDEDAHEATVCVSDESTDRAGEIVKISAWDGGGLDDYKNHPVLLSSHKRDKLTHQIGKCTKVWIEAGKMYARFKWFVGDGNEEADWGWKLISKYKVAAFSISFIVKAMENLTEQMMKNGVWGIISKASMTEISQVTVPCNANALSLSMKSFEEKKDSFSLSVAEKIKREIDKESAVEVNINKQIIEGFKSAFDNLKDIAELKAKVSALEASNKQLSDKLELMLDEFCKSEKQREIDVVVNKEPSKEVMDKLEELKKILK